MKSILTFITVLLVAQICMAATVNVPGDYPTIQQGIDAALVDDTVLVAPDIYTGTGNRDLNFNGKPLIVKSADGPETTIIDIQGTSSDPHRGFKFFNLEDTSSVVEGFTIRNGFGPEERGSHKAGAIYCDSSSPLIIDCIFLDNLGDHNGGAVATFGCSPVFMDCSFINNYAVHGGGIYFNGRLVKDGEDNSAFLGISNPIVSDCEFIGNSASPSEGWGGGIYTQYGDISVTLDGCLFYDNSAVNGGGFSSESDANIYMSNCTFVHNSASIGGNLLFVGDGITNVSNTISVFSLTGHGLYINDLSQFTITCSDIYGNAGGDIYGLLGPITDFDGVNGNFMADPLFCDIDNNDYHVDIVSPCAAYANSCGTLIGALDIGCSDFADLPVALSISYSPPNISWVYFDTATTIQMAYEIEVGTDNDWSSAEMWSTDQIYSSDLTVSYGGLPLDDNTTYYLRIRVYNGTEWGSWNEKSFFVHTGNAIYVPSELPTIQAAIDASNDYDTVIVEPGTYTGDGNRDLNMHGKKVVVISQDGPETTIIDCQGSASDRHRAFYFSEQEDNNSVVDGFTITGGYALHESDDYKGGAVFINNASPLIKNCIFDSNFASRTGGAIHVNYSSVQLQDCVFSNNESTHGGAIYINGNLNKMDSIAYGTFNPAISDCVFYDNYGSGYGGGIYYQYNNIDLTIENCLFHNNTADNGGALADGGTSNVSMTNCTLAGNSAPEGSAYGSWTSSQSITINNCIIAFNGPGIPVTSEAELTCCDVYGNIGGDYVGPIADQQEINNNFSLDPLFCDTIFHDYHLSPYSPCRPEGNACDLLIGALGVGDCTPKAIISIDRSGSMFYENPMGLSRLERAQELAHMDIIKLLDDNDPDYPGIIEVAIMYFNADGIVLQQDFSTDATALHDAIDAIPSPRHDTPLAAAMCQAHCNLNDNYAAPGIAITYTDGLENVSPEFDMCEICEPCNQYMSSGWNYECDLSSPTGCTEWQLCLADVFMQYGINEVRYFGEPINPFGKSGGTPGLEDMYFLKSTAEFGNGTFNYYSDQATICGDANSDGAINISDAVFLVSYVFIGGESPTDYYSADTNCDQTVNVSDAVWIINYIFTGGNDPCDSDGDGSPDC
jgi:predicted outer membrane repeat protein